MRPLFLAAAIATTALTGAALARQAAPPRPGADGVVTRAEALALADQRFALIDTDNDGRLTAAEIAAMPRPRGPMRDMPPPPAPGADAGTPPPPGGGRGMGGARMLERADADRDGVVSRDEYRAQATAMFDRQDTNRDGRIDAAERDRQRERRMERRGDD